MRSKILFCLIMLLATTSKAKDFDLLHPPYLLENGMKSGYFIDSVYMDNYVIVESGINQQMFIVTDSTYVPKRQNRKFWNEKNCIIYSEQIADIYYYFRIVKGKKKSGFLDNEYDLEKVWPYRHDRNIRYVEWDSHAEKDRVCSYKSNKPTLFGVFLLAGNYYNHLSAYNCLDCVVPDPINFKCPTAYYVVYVPIR